eukprot:6439403-Pyramimonas_sp.AAC.1
MEEKGRWWTCLPRRKKYSTADQEEASRLKNRSQKLRQEPGKDTVDILRPLGLCKLRSCMKATC